MKTKMDTDLEKPKTFWYVLMALGAAIALFLGTGSWLIALAVGIGLSLLLFSVARE